MEKRKNCWIISTDKPSRLIKLHNGELRYNQNSGLHNFYPQNIYITSDEKLNIKDWVLNSGDYDKDIVFQVDEMFFNIGLEAKKIILTTDQDLIKDGVQAIDDEFLEWFIKNPNCQKVEIETKPNLYIHFGSGKYWEDAPVEMKKILGLGDLIYKIIIPKEESKIFLKKEYVDDQDAYGYNILVREETKQETLEEAAITNCQSITHPYCNREKAMFINGAKWQQERSYSEEDMLEFGEWMKILPLTISGFVVKTKSKSIVIEKTKQLLQIWFEQFKKK